MIDSCWERENKFSPVDYLWYINHIPTQPSCPGSQETRSWVVHQHKNRLHVVEVFVVVWLIACFLFILLLIWYVSCVYVLFGFGMFCLIGFFCLFSLFVLISVLSFFVESGEKKEHRIGCIERWGRIWEVLRDGTMWSKYVVCKKFLNEKFKAVDKGI